MKPFFSMVRANLKMTLRDRTRLFWLLLFPALFIVIFGSLVGNDSDFKASVAVVNGGATPIAKKMTSVMRSSKLFQVKSGTEKADLVSLKQGDLDAVVVFPANGTAGQPLQVKSYVDESQRGTSQATAATINQIAQRFDGAAEPANRGNELVALTTQGVQGKGFNYVDFLVPGILAMSIMQGGIVGLSGAFVTMRERGILRRMKVTPFPLASFITARIITQLLVAMCQSAILLGLARLVFGLNVVGNFLILALLVILGSLAFLTVGFLIAGISGKQEGATALAQLVSFPMLFLSGVFFPLEQSPAWLQELAKALPLSYLADGLRRVMVYGAPLWSLRGDVGALILTAAIGLVLAARFFRWEPVKAT